MMAANIFQKLTGIVLTVVIKKVTVTTYFSQHVVTLSSGVVLGGFLGFPETPFGLDFDRLRLKS